MSIKQNGGVFGRNPTFNDVTIEGQLTFDGDIDVNSDLKVDGDLEVTGNTTLSGDITFPTVGSIKQIGNEILIVSGNTGLYIDDANNWVRPSNPTLGNRSDTINLGEPNNKFKNLYLSRNVIVGSGYGIDFSATAGTGTSELFDDYEEGTFTVSAARITDLTTNVGRYTKIGNLVTCEINLSWTATDNSGNDVIFTGLPFTSATGTEAGVGPALIYGTDVNTDVGQAIVLRIDDNQTRFFLHTAIAASLDSVNASAMNSATTLRATFSYTAS
jgi:hypothetical protein